MAEPKTDTVEEPEKVSATPREKFRTRAATRVNAALEAMDQIGKLNSPAYEYTEADVAAIDTALTQRVVRIMKILRGELQAEGFTLPE